MGSGPSNLSYRTAFVELINKTQPIDAHNDEFWNQFWCQGPIPISNIFASIPGSDIRNLREEAPGNLATLCYKTVERLALIAEASFPTTQDQQTVINCVRLLTRIMPYIFEVPEWRPFFWSVSPSQTDVNSDSANNVPLAQTLISSLCDLLFCPDFTVHSIIKPGPENAEDMHTIDSCEYIWEAGVGFAQSPTQNAQHDANRTEIIRLLLVCFSETVYLTQTEARKEANKWVAFCTGPENRHVLPLFTSLLNVVCAYNPASSSLPYNHLMFTDSREPLVEVSLQLLCVTLEANIRNQDGSEKNQSDSDSSDHCGSNLFLNYMSRIHRDEDFSFILDGITRLLNNPLTSSYLPGSAKKVQMHQELLLLFWRICDINKKFMLYVLKSSRVLDVLVPILYHLNASRNDKSQLGLMHIGVFILLLLSGERNFGVRLNKPFANRTSFDITVFPGNHADLLIIIFHKVITTGHQCLQPLFDCLITIIDNVSPYVKSLSMISASRLMHLMEAFSQPWFLFSGPNNYQLVLYLLEVFNNIIQYQFDGNSCLVYSIIRKRQIFYQLANIPTSDEEIREVLVKHGGLRRRFEAPPDSEEEEEDEDEEEEEEDLGEQTENVSEADVENTKEVYEKGAEVEESANSANSALSNSKAKGEEEKEVGRTRTEDIPVIEENAKQALATLDLQPEGELAVAADRHEEDEFAPSFSHPKGTVPVSPTERDTLKVADESRQLEAAVDLKGEEAAPKKGGNEINVKEKDDKVKIPAVKEKVAKEDLRFSCTKMTPSVSSAISTTTSATASWRPTARWVAKWHEKLPLQTVMRLLQVLVPQVEKICIKNSLKDEPQILKFLQNGTLVGLLPVPHPILIRKYQSNMDTTVWFLTYIWGAVYLRNSEPPIWFDTNVRLFEVQRT